MINKARKVTLILTLIFLGNIIDIPAFGSNTTEPPITKAKKLTTWTDYADAAMISVREKQSDPNQFFFRGVPLQLVMYRFQDEMLASENTVKNAKGLKKVSAAFQVAQNDKNSVKKLDEDVRLLINKGADPNKAEWNGKKGYQLMEMLADLHSVNHPLSFKDIKTMKNLVKLLKDWKAPNS